MSLEKVVQKEPTMLREFYDALQNERFRLTRIREEITESLHKLKNTNYPTTETDACYDIRGNEDFEYELFLVLEFFKNENIYLQQQLTKLQSIV